MQEGADTGRDLAVVPRPSLRQAGARTMPGTSFQRGHHTSARGPADSGAQVGQVQRTP